MTLKTKSVVHMEILDAAAAAIEGAFNDGKLIAATLVARQILEANPNSGISVDELADKIGRLAAAKGISVEFGAEGLTGNSN